MSGNRQEPEPGSPAGLVAIAVAARWSGDRDLEREARDALERRFGVRLSFPRKYWPTTRRCETRPNGKGVGHA